MQMDFDNEANGSKDIFFHSEKLSPIFNFFCDSSMLQGDKYILYAVMIT
jgi:hypothetical protein